MNEGSRYLDLAERVISAQGTPLSGSQIIAFAQEYDALPFHSYQTIVKTLQARIAEDIARNRGKSRFFRTGIGMYFLQRLAQGKEKLGAAGRSKTRAPRRKPEHPYRILTISAETLRDGYFMQGWAQIEAILQRGKYEYQSEIPDGHLSVVTCAAIHWKDSFYTFDVGVHTHFETLSGSRTIFLRKFVDEFDLDLFETDGTGVTSSTARTLLPILTGC